MTAGTFGGFIRGLDMPVGELAERVGLDASTGSQWRRGHEPTDTNLVRLARVIGIPVADLAAKCRRWQDPTPLRLARWRAGLETAEVAVMLGVSAGLVRVWEVEGRHPPEDMAVRLAGIYGIDVVPEVRPATPFPYAGGKVRRLDQLAGLVPVGDLYVEPFGGAGAMLLSRDPVPGTREVLNDLDGDIVNLFRVLRDPDQAGELHRRLSLTPYARAEYNEAVQLLRFGSPDGLLRAWATFVVVSQSFNSSSRPAINGWSSGGPSPRWWRRVAWIDSWHERLANVTLEADDALNVIDRYDGPGTVFYVDPPYHPDTRTNRVLYRQELDAAGHQRLVERLLDIQGVVVLSGYQHPIYEQLEQRGWSNHQLGGKEHAWRSPSIRRAA